jgi:predicted DNA binding protein
MDGIRAEVTVHSPDQCPVAAVTAGTDAESSSVSRVEADGSVIEEFLIEGAGESPPTDAADLEEVFSYGSRRAVRFERDAEGRCPCETVERSGTPLLDVRASDGGLVLTFHAGDLDALQVVLERLRSRWSNVSVHRLVQTSEERSGEDLALVDRSRLTDRQREVMTVAHEMGYFDHPKGANASEVAEELGITRATFTEHLSAAQRKLLETVLDGPEQGSL